MCQGKIEMSPSGQSRSVPFSSLELEPVGRHERDEKAFISSYILSEKMNIVNKISSYFAFLLRHQQRC